jgi:hypothetical protein
MHMADRQARRASSAAAVKYVALFCQGIGLARICQNLAYPGSFLSPSLLPVRKVGEKCVVGRTTVSLPASIALLYPLVACHRSRSLPRCFAPIAKRRGK